MTEAAQRTFFLKFDGEVKKVIVSDVDADVLYKAFKDKFESSVNDPAQLSFYIEDKDFGVFHKLEDIRNQLYDGAILEVRLLSDSIDTITVGDSKKRSQETDAPASKRRRTDDSPEHSTSAEPHDSHHHSELDGDQSEQSHSHHDGARSDTARALIDPSFLVRLRGLPWGTSKEDVIQFFSGLSIATDGVYLVTNPEGRLTGEAFVRFTDEKAATEALSRDHQNIGSRYIEVYASNETELQRMKALALSGGGVQPYNPKSVVLKLRGLPYSADEAEVKQFFASDPNLRIVGVHITYDRGGRPSGAAFIEVESEEQASLALAFHKKHMGTRYIEIAPSTMGELQGHGSSRGGGGGGRYERQDRHDRYDRYADRDVRDRHDRYDRSDRYDSRHQGYDSRPPQRSSHPVRQDMSFDSNVLFMRGLPFDANADDIGRFFYDVRVTPCRILHKPGSGEAIVEFTHPQETARAMQMNYGYMGRRYIELSPMSYDEFLDLMSRRSGGAGAGRSSRPAERPYSRPPYDSGHGHGHRERSEGDALVKMHGLPFRATAMDVVNFFRPFDISEAAVKFLMDKSGRPSGEAIVRFQNVDIARRACRERDNCYLHDRYILLKPL